MIDYTVHGLEQLNRQLAGVAEQYGFKPNDTAVPVVTTGYTAAYAAAVHEDVEMKWRGFSRDPRVRRLEMGGDPARARPRPRVREPKGRFWDPQGRGKAKFLEDPARRMQRELGAGIVSDAKGGVPFPQALLRAGLKLQRESMLEVPVDTANLKMSAFTRLDYVQAGEA